MSLREVSLVFLRNVLREALMGYADARTDHLLVIARHCVIPGDGMTDGAAMAVDGKPQ